MGHREASCKYPIYKVRTVLKSPLILGESLEKSLNSTFYEKSLNFWVSP